MASGRCLRSSAEFDTLSLALSSNGRTAALVCLAGQRSGSTMRMSKVEAWDVHLGHGYRAPAVVCGTRGTGLILSAQRAGRRALEEARRALRDGDTTVALAHVRAARAQRGLERDPAVLDAWSELARALRHTGLRGVWMQRELGDHSEAVTGLIVAPEGDRAISASADGTVSSWELSTGRRVSVLEAHGGHGVAAVCLGCEGTVWSAGFDGTLRKWSLGSGRLVLSIDGAPTGLHGLALSPDGRVLACGGALFDADAGRLLKVLAGRAPVCFTTDGRGVVLQSASDDETVLVFDVTSGAQRASYHLQADDSGLDALPGLATGDTGRVKSVAAAGGWLIASHASGLINVWHEEAARRLEWVATDSSAPWEHTTDLTLLEGQPAVCLTPDGRYLFGGGSEDEVQLWDLWLMEPLERLRGNPGRVKAIALSPDAEFLLSGDSNGRIVVWRIDWELAADEADSAESWQLATRLLRVGRPEDALATVERALLNTPGDEHLLCIRGNVLVVLQRLDEALACFDRALGLHPKWLVPQLGRSSVLVEGGQPEAALRVLDEAFVAMPGRAAWTSIAPPGLLRQAWLLKARALVLLGRQDEAAECVHRARSPF